MNINAVSAVNHQAPLQQSSAAASVPARVKDNDGDYDNGTGADDAVNTEAVHLLFVFSNRGACRGDIV